MLVGLEALKNSERLLNNVRERMITKESLDSNIDNTCLLKCINGIIDFIIENYYATHFHSKLKEYLDKQKGFNNIYLISDCIVDGIKDCKNFYDFVEQIKL